MFNQLRNHFIILNMAIMTAVLLVSFGAIYITSCAVERSRDFRNTPPGSQIIYVEQFSESDMDVIIQQREYDSERALDRLLMTLIATGLATLGMVLLVSWYSAEKAIQPVREAWKKQKYFVANASHELKTPLATIDANFDALLADHKINNTWTLNIKGAITRMDKLVQDLLCLAKVDIADKPLEKSKFDVSKTVNAMVTTMEAMAFEKGIKLVNEVESGLTIESNEELIQQITAILIDNAIKYSATKNGRVGVTLRRVQGRVALRVENNGHGIPAKDLPKIFERFYQSDSSHSSGGSGLGLSIAKAAAGRLGARLTVTSDKKLTTFTLALPKNQPRAPKKST